MWVDPNLILLIDYVVSTQKKQLFVCTYSICLILPMMEKGLRYGPDFHNSCETLYIFPYSEQKMRAEFSL